MKDDSLQIKLVKKNPHKVFQAEVSADHHIKSLCKFLRKQKDRNLEIVINGKSFKFDSIAGRKRFASGFEQAFSIIEPHMAKFVKDLEDRLNKVLSERDKAKSEAKQNYQKYIDTVESYRVKHTVMDLRSAAWKDHVAELEEDRKYLSEQVKLLRKELERKNVRKKKPRKKSDSQPT